MWKKMTMKWFKKKIRQLRMDKNKISFRNEELKGKRKKVLKQKKKERVKKWEEKKGKELKEIWEKEKENKE